MNKIKIFLNFSLVVTVLLAIMTGALFYFYQQKFKIQQNIINSQNALLRDSKTRDSIYTENNKEYAKTIKRYTSDENCSIRINGKIYSFNEFIALYDKLNVDNYKIKDSLKYFEQVNKEVAAKISKINSDFIKSDPNNKRIIDSMIKKNR